MSSILEIWVDGIPKAQPRIKAFVRGSHAGVYTPATARSWRTKIWATILENPHRRPSEGPIMAKLSFLFPRPKSHFRGRNRDILKDNAPHHVQIKPDIDNLTKAVYDAITDSKKVWCDDCQVVKQLCQKTYVEFNETPGCRITISTLSNDDEC